MTTATVPKHDREQLGPWYNAVTTQSRLSHGQLRYRIDVETTKLVNENGKRRT